MPLPASRSKPASCQLPPGDAAGQHDRARAQDVAAVEVDLAGRGVDPLDRPRHQDLRAEPARLRQRAAGELVARHAGREPEVVLDPRRGARLPAGRLALDDDRPQALRGAVDGRGQAGRAGADDHRVVLRVLGLGAEAEQLGHPAEPRPDHGLPADEPDRRQVGVGRRRAAPHLGGVGRVRGEPPEGHLVAVEEAAQLGAVPRPSGGPRRSRAAAAARRPGPAARARRPCGGSRACRPPPRGRAPGPRPRGSRAPRGA